jgi:acetylornithine deacetylase/succinyl-diaminopimelate desuccinylase-like protein
VTNPVQHVSDPTQTLREVVEALAPLRKRAGTEEERQAALWIAERLRVVGLDAAVDEEQFYDGYAKQLMPLGVAGVVAGALTLRGRARLLATLLGALGAAGIVDDVSNGKRIWRRMLGQVRTTWNVVAEAGDRDAERTLVVLAHHDAAPTGRVFDQSFQRWLARRYPDLVQRSDTGLGLWWPVVAGPVTSAVAAATRSRPLAAFGTALSALGVYLGIDIAREQIVPGANDNLSAVAALVAVAERLRDEPLGGVRVLLASCGAEEVLQGGIYGLVAAGPGFSTSTRSAPRSW